MKNTSLSATILLLFPVMTAVAQEAGVVRPQQDRPTVVSHAFPYPRWTSLDRDTAGALTAVPRMTALRSIRVQPTDDACHPWKPALAGAVLGGIGSIVLAKAWDRHSGGFGADAFPVGRSVVLIPIGFAGTVVGGFTGALIGMRNRDDCGCPATNRAERNDIWRLLPLDLVLRERWPRG